MRSLLLGAATVVTLALLLAPLDAEPCLSPFLKPLDRPEKLLYVYCLDADGKKNDFLAVVDVEKGSKNYGRITYQLDLGSAGNETHHFGYTDDRPPLWVLTLFSGRPFLIDVATDPARPKLAKVIDNLGAPAGLSS